MICFVCVCKYVWDIKMLASPWCVLDRNLSSELNEH